MDEGLLSIISSSYGQFVKMLISFEPHGIFGSNFAYLYTVFENVWENDKVNKKDIMKKILVMPGLEPLCVRLLDYDRAS